MLKAEFHHFGVPTQEKQKNERYIEGAKVFVTEPEENPFRIEFLRFEEGTSMPPEVCQGAHAAYMVSSLDEAMAGREVIVPPFNASDTLRCAFIKDGDAVIEIMEQQ
ncbi:MAG: hypothetical protein GX117_04880 [Candidatus Hydrogenedentes bacterium]|nr:hypothetical protein [Candidatus Hydrogenedentota bacterium]